MTNYSRRVFEMLVRVLVFRTTYRELIGKDSNADQLFQKVDAAFKKIDAESTLQTTGQNAVRLSSDDRTSARVSLRKQLESITQTAASMGLKEFFMPRDRGDRRLAEVGGVIAKMAEPLKNEFIANHMPDDFIERLNATVDTIKRSIEQQAESKGARKAATTAIGKARAEALAALTRLDPIMDNLLRDNEPVKSVWDAARHIQKAAKVSQPPPPRPTLLLPERSASSSA